jgi:hypothetical protein
MPHADRGESFRVMATAIANLGTTAPPIVHPCSQRARERESHGHLGRIAIHSDREVPGLRQR